MVELYGKRYLYASNVDQLDIEKKKCAQLNFNGKKKDEKVYELKI